MNNKFLYKIVNIMPDFIINLVLKMRGLFQFSTRIRMKRKINKYFENNNMNNNWEKKLNKLANYGKVFSEFIDEFMLTEIKCQSIKKSIEYDAPLVICVVKNDLVRVQMLLNYYRKIGIKCFAFLDDNSNDGTREYLNNQEDVIVYTSNKEYSTVRRQVWINKMIDDLGINKWFLIIDSDEVFDYDKKNNETIQEYIKKLENNNETRVKSILLDMFSENGMYLENINPDQIMKEYKYFLNDYYLEKTPYDTRIRGGGRKLLFDDLKRTPIVSKYPLIYVDDKDIIINSHYNFPLKRNKPIRPSTVLLHYKFLAGDKKKYAERIKKGNFHNGSIDYQNYLNNYSDMQNKMHIENMIEYRNFLDANNIDLFNKKKIYITTVYDSLNYGSFFQAKALKDEFERYGDVYFVNINHQNILFQTINSVARKIIKTEIHAAVLEWKKYIKIKSSQKKEFKIVRFNKLKDTPNNYYLFGSDEIWNISRKKMLKSKEFFGKGFPNTNRISISPSINQSTIEEFRKYPYIKEELLKFKSVSVRDDYSKKIIDKLGIKNVKMLSDPTLMYSAEHYLDFDKKNNERNYIVLYTYGKMLNTKTIKKIIDFSKSNNLKIISIGRFFSFCDENLAASPYEFLDYVCNAKYIFTDTFHGLMFSLIFNKEFIVFPCGNRKVEETLKYFDLLRRICDDETSIEEIINKKLDYNIINTKINNFGSLTREFIEKNLN